MSVIAVGDIHGNIRALNDLLNVLTRELSDADELVFLGDYIDRGMDSRACIERILEVIEESPCPVICLMGNHEDWMLRILDDPTSHSWILGMEAFDTIHSYSPEAANQIRKAGGEAGVHLITKKTRLPYELFLGAVPEEHLAFLKNLRISHRSRDVLCVHGGINPHVSRLEDQDREAVIWGMDDFPAGYTGSETIVYGHWNRFETDERGVPMPLATGRRTYCIDTISTGILTAMRFPDRTVFQSRQFK